MTNYFKKNSNQLIVVLVFLVLAIFSFFAMSKIYDAKPWFPGASQSLDDKKLEVMGLASSSTGASVAITLLPGDIGTTVADKMADLSGYFIMIVIVIYLEKFLMLFAGTLVFKVLIPVSCLAFIVGILFPRIRYWANQMGAKLLVMAVLFLSLFLFLWAYPIRLTSHIRLTGTRPLKMQSRVRKKFKIQIRVFWRLYRVQQQPLWKHLKNC